VEISRHTSYFPVSGEGLTYGTLDQYVSLSIINAGVFYRLRSCSFLTFSSLTPYGYYKMGVICPHDSAGSMCIMWVNLVQVSPTWNDLLTQ